MTHKIKSRTTYTGHVLCSYCEFEALDAGDAQMHKWFTPEVGDFAAVSDTFDSEADLIAEIEIFERALSALRAGILKDFENDH